MNDDETAVGVLHAPAAAQSAGLVVPAQGVPDAFDAAPVGLMALDVTGRILRVNPALGRLLGRRPETLKGRLVFECLTVEDGQRVREQLARHRSADEDGIEVDVRDADGRPQRCIVHVARTVDAQCDPTGWLVSWTPQPAPRVSVDEGRLYEVTLNAIEDSVAVVDKDGIYRMVNDAWCRRHRMARAQVIGRVAKDVFSAIDLTGAMPAFRGCLNDRRMTRAFIDGDLSGGGFGRRRLDFYPFGDDAGEVPKVVIVERVVDGLLLSD